MKEKDILCLFGTHSPAQGRKICLVCSFFIDISKTIVHTECGGVSFPLQIMQPIISHDS